MPTPPDTTEPGRVSVAADVSLPRRFTRSFMTKLDETRVAHTQVTVLMSDDGTPLLAEYRFIPPADGLRPDELRRPDLRGLLRWAYVGQIAHELTLAKVADDGAHGEGWSYLELSDSDDEAIYLQAEAIGRPRGPYRVTDDFLRAVVEQHRVGGVKLVAKEHDTSERTVRRWLSEARERGVR